MANIIVIQFDAVWLDAWNRQLAQLSYGRAKTIKPDNDCKRAIATDDEERWDSTNYEMVSRFIRDEYPETKEGDMVEFDFPPEFRQSYETEWVLYIWSEGEASRLDHHPRLPGSLYIPLKDIGVTLSPHHWDSLLKRDEGVRLSHYNEIRLEFAKHKKVPREVKWFFRDDIPIDNPRDSKMDENGDDVITAVASVVFPNSPHPIYLAVSDWCDDDDLEDVMKSVRQMTLKFNIFDTCILERKRDCLLDIATCIAADTHQDPDIVLNNIFHVHESMIRPEEF